MPFLINFAFTILVVSFVIFCWWYFFYVPRPQVPPLQIDPDDVLMQEAIAKAKGSIEHFRELAEQPNQGVRVKVPFVTSTGVTEHLWAEVLALQDAEMEIRYLTPPVTHTGRLERIHTCPVADLTDWQVELTSGNYAGGFTMRVMFVRGRELWGSLPRELESEEAKYV